MNQYPSIRLAIAALVALAPQTGCDKLDQIDVTEVAKQTAGKAKQAAAKAVEVIKAETTRTGSISILLDRPLKTERCYGMLARPGQGRPAVLRVSSYEHVDGETFPSVYVHAEVPDEGAAKLKGTVVQGQIFVQWEASGPVWQAPHDKPVELMLSEIDDGSFRIEIVTGELVSTGGGTSSVTGTLQGLMR